MEEDWGSVADPKEKKRIQNRLAQRVHREKLKSRIRQLEQQLESVSGASTQNGTTKPVSSYDDPTSSFTVAGALPTTHCESVPGRWGTSLSDITFVGNHALDPLLESNTTIESNSNTTVHTSVAAHLDSLSRTPAEVQPVDLEWLLKDSGASRTLLGRTRLHSPSVERGYKTPGQSQSPPGTSFSRHLSSLDHVRNGSNSGHSIHKTTTVPTTPNIGHETLLEPDATRMERLSLLLECSRRLGFSDLNEALSVYYTADLSKSAILSHEQSLNRVRQLPSFLSNIREHSKQWPAWERANYVREMLRSAEDIYAEECGIARANLRDQGIVNLAQKELHIGQMFQITRVLQQEIPNTWAMITSIILHTVMPGEPQPPQTILMIMMLLCYRNQDPITTLGLCQEYLHQSDGANETVSSLLH